jgi:hypothetical protein
MIEGDIELSHLVEEYDQATEEEKKQYKQDTLEQLQRLAILYKHQNQDELGIFTVIAEALGFKAYPGQSMMGEDVMHFLIGNKEEGYGLMDMFYNSCPDEEIVEQLLADDI